MAETADRVLCRGEAAMSETAALAAENTRLRTQLDEAVRLLRKHHFGCSKSIYGEPCDICDTLASIDKEPEDA